jgi:hypothetical protein
MVEQAEILEDDADPPAERGQLVLLQRRGILAEDRDQAARGFQGKLEQADQRGLAGARRPGQELKRLRRDLKAQIAQYFRPNAVAEPDILESDQNVCPAMPTGLAAA